MSPFLTCRQSGWLGRQTRKWGTAFREPGNHDWERYGIISWYPRTSTAGKVEYSDGTSSLFMDEKQRINYFVGKAVIAIYLSIWSANRCGLCVCIVCWLRCSFQTHDNCFGFADKHIALTTSIKWAWFIYQYFLSYVWRRV